MKKIHEDSDANVREWLQSLAADTSIKVTIKRKTPKTWQGQRIAGSIETVEEMIDEDYIRDNYGGGQYSIQVLKPNETGKYVYGGSRSIEIAGPPKLNHIVDDVAGVQQVAVGPSVNEKLAEHAFRTMERSVQRAEERQDRGNGNSGLDTELLKALNQPMIAQLEAAREESKQLRDQLYMLMGKEPPSNVDPFRDRLMERMIDGESGRIESIRAQHESEIRSLKENYESEKRQMREQFRDDLKTRERQHERELEVVRNSYEAQVKSNEIAYGTRHDGMESEANRLNRELTEARARIGALEERKDQTITDKAEELVKVREALGVLGGGDSDDDSDKPWYERLAGIVGESSVVAKMLGIPTGEEPPAQPQPEAMQMAPPVGVPFEGPDGKVYVRQQDNSIIEVPDPRAARKKKAAEARAKGKTRARTRQPDKDEVAMAVTFLENAINNRMDPAVVGASARGLIPADILAHIQEVGVDEFLTKVAVLDGASPLRNQYGKNFARKVAKFLMEGTTE
jgi:hypothetical protein